MGLGNRYRVNNTSETCQLSVVTVPSLLTHSEIYDLNLRRVRYWFFFSFIFYFLMPTAGNYFFFLPQFLLHLCLLRCSWVFIGLLLIFQEWRESKAFQNDPGLIPALHSKTVFQIEVIWLPFPKHEELTTESRNRKKEERPKD